MENENLIQAGQSPADESVNLRHYWHIILERRWLVIAAFISVFVLSLIYLFKATPIFLASARIQIDREMDNILRIEGLTVTGAQEQDYLQTQYKNLLSRTLIQSVINQLRLDKDEHYAKRGYDIVKAVADDIQVVPIRLSRLVDIKVEHPEAAQAALIANTLVKTFIQGNVDQKINAANDILARLRTEADIQKDQLQRAQEALQAYSTQEKNVSFEDNENIVLQALRQYQQAFAQARSEAEIAQKIFDQVTEMIQAGEPIEAIPYVQRDPEISVLTKEFEVLTARFAGIKQRYKHKMTEYKETEEQLRSLQDSIAKQANTLIQSLRNNAIILRENAEKLGKLVADQEARQLSLNEKKIKYDVLKREADQSDLLYKMVLQRLKETDITSKNKLNNMRPVDLAEAPIRPVKPRWVLTILLGIIGGLGIAIGLAFFVNYLDDSIKSQDDVETYLRLPFLGYIPNIKTNSVVERDLQAHLHPQSNAAEGFRTIRATISLTHKQDKFHVVAVTSTIPSEGKSLVASNLAIVTAQTGLKTLLIDADLRRPSVHKAYQLHSPTGLSSYLSEEMNDIETIVHRTEVPNLDVVCCGSVPTTPSELIGSKRMQQFLQLARGRYDRVLLDCPPISAVSDPLIISAMSDGVVFVTKFNKIRREHARKSIQRVQNAGIHILGVVLNDIDFEGKDSYYYSYYYYQNRYYASHYKTKPERNKEKAKEEPVVKSRNGGA
ncbi:MAG: polysaccharide biosynthesis tyrosine autokinase [Verrucomicrobiales bacterium]|nr:polysaccharide biosynthesis tyrosine autokinase [Verrucomicrobiales bacterium]